MRLLIKYLLIFFLWGTSAAQAMIHVVAAENFYGEVAKQLGGPYISVFSIVNNVSQDPHLFTVSPSIAKKIADADIIIYNGADYDPWMKPLLSTHAMLHQRVIVVSDLICLQRGANPHIWYKPETMPIFATEMVRMLSADDPAHADYFSKQLQTFQRKYQMIFITVKRLNAKYKNLPIIATEPIFNDMAERLGLVMQGQGFQQSMMNDIAPTITQIQAFESALRHRTVRLLIYNKQVSNPMTERMLALAKQQNIPVIGVTETLPLSMTYVQWMLEQLSEVERALQ